MSAFPDDELAAARRQFQTLYRLESDNRGRLTVLVQSRTEPDWSRIPEGYLVDLPGDNPAVAPMNLLLSQVKVGGVYHFRLRANATKRIRTGTEEAGKRVEIFGFDALALWFERKASDAGFAANAGQWISSLVINEEAKVLGHRGNSRLTFGSTLFEGQLRVTDVDRFKQAIGAGIGSAKAYGFGLLSIAPLSGK
jgi:CRISPR system Cascade subunit CasE